MKIKLSHPAKIIAVCVIGILISSCTGLPGFNRKVSGSGNVVKETRDVHNFTEVVISEEGDLFIENGDHEELIIEAEDNLQEFLFPEIINNVLDIKKLPENVTLNVIKPIRYYLTVKELESLTVKNSGDVDITEVDTDIFSIRITGSGSVHIGSLTSHRVDIELTSSGNLAIDLGEVDEQNVRLSSSGDYDSKGLVSQTAFAEITSSGDAALNVLNLLTADLSSSGNVYYVGRPKIVYKDTSSTGRVIPLP